jgi:iron complex transport system substrate-binding protein
MKRKILEIKLILTGVVLLSVSNVFAEPFTYKDKLGRTITVQIPVKRAVLLTSSDLLPITNAWSQVVGVSHGASEDNDLLKAVKPDMAQLIPSVGNNHNINIEVLLRLNPDIVLAWSSNRNIIDYLEKKKVPVIAVSPESITELYEMMRLEGKLFGSEKSVESAIARMEEMFDLIRKRVAAVPPEQRKKSLWINSKPTTVSGGISINNDLLAIVGQENQGREIKQRSTDVSLEQIAAWNPDVIYIWGRARYSANDILDNPQWRHIKAVKGRRVFKVPKWDTWSPRLAPLALWMAAAAYPKQFEDIDINKTIDKFYRDVYNIPYSKVRQIEN